MEILGTTKISYEIERILDESENYLILVSPYLKLNQRLKVRLSDSFKRTEKSFILYRENELKKEDTMLFESDLMLSYDIYNQLFSNNHNKSFALVDKYASWMDGTVLEIDKAGSMSPEEFDVAMFDLVNFLAYVAEPMTEQRKHIGKMVLLFLLLLLVPVVLLNREYWKGIH